MGVSEGRFAVPSIGVSYRALTPHDDGSGAPLGDELAASPDRVLRYHKGLLIVSV